MFFLLFKNKYSFHSIFFGKKEKDLPSTTSFVKRSSAGISLIEIIIGLSVIFLSLVSVITTYNFFLVVSNRNINIIKAEFLIEEGIEIARFLRDSSWTNFVDMATTTDQYFAFNNGTWKATTTNIYIDEKFERKFTILDIYRDGSSDIVFTGGSLDIGTKQVDIDVSWRGKGATTTLSRSVFLANLFEE